MTSSGSATGGHRRHGMHAVRRALRQGRQRPADRCVRRGAGSAGVAIDAIDAFWYGTRSGKSGLTLSKPLKIDYKPVTRVENCARPDRRPSGMPVTPLPPVRTNCHGNRSRKAEGFGLFWASPASTRGGRHNAVADPPGRLLVPRTGLRPQVRRRPRRDARGPEADRLEEPPERGVQPAGPVPETKSPRTRSPPHRGWPASSGCSTAAGYPTGRPPPSSAGRRTPTGTPTSRCT